jgi:3'-5' exoribonuclease
MRETRQNEPITSWNEGDNVSGFALVSRKELRQDRNNKDFLDLELKDASGSIVGKAWSDSAALASEFEAHQFVAFRGQVKRYRDQLQLNVVECRRATDEDRRFGFDESVLVPSTREDIDDLWSRLSAIYTGDGIRRPVLRRLGEETLTTLEDRLREHPAAKAIHHAYRGGLLEHTVSMAELAVRICGHYRQIDRDLVLLGVLFHDLGKLEELGAMPANDYTLEGRLVGHVIIGRDLLLERCAAIDGFFAGAADDSGSVRVALDRRPGLEAGSAGAGESVGRGNAVDTGVGQVRASCRGARGRRPGSARGNRRRRAPGDRGARSPTGRDQPSGRAGTGTRRRAQPSSTRTALTTGGFIAFIAPEPAGQEGWSSIPSSERLREDPDSPAPGSYRFIR